MILSLKVEIVSRHFARKTRKVVIRALLNLKELVFTT